MASGGSVTSLRAFDVRFPTSLTLDGSDAVHTSPDYSLAYVILSTSDSAVEGHGFTFTIGRGTEVVVCAVNALKRLVVGQPLSAIFADFGAFSSRLTNDSQLRWLGPEKGVIHLAVAAVVNALWDLRAKLEQKPLWRLLVDMSAEELVQLIDFRYMSDCLTKKEALTMLKSMEDGKAARIEEVLRDGVPAYITSVGWMGYDDAKIARLCREALSDGWTRCRVHLRRSYVWCESCSFKMKVGVNAADDARRAGVIRDVIGYDNFLMMDANQVWEVSEAVERMADLARFKPLWIEEPTSPDDVMGHATVASVSPAFLPALHQGIAAVQALHGVDVGVAGGEHCQNRVLFKQFLSSGALQFCQVDACRLGGVNEVLAVLLLAAKFKVPVCPHAGGVGLCELVPHLAIINFVCVTASWHNVFVEYADHLHEHFVDPAVVKGGRYLAPNAAGYSATLKSDSLLKHIVTED